MQCKAELDDNASFCPRCGGAVSRARSPKEGLRGTVLAERYLLEERIGQGGMGAIYRAQQLNLGRSVCVKLLHPHAASDEHLVQRFQREARVLSEIQHPNIVTVLDFGNSSLAVQEGEAENQTLFIVMEMVDGLDLGRILSAKKRLSLKASASLLIQICDALDEAHARGVVHRDLKPQNIMVYSTRHGETMAKVLDFGIAKILDSPNSQEAQLTSAGSVFGTPEYMSPEQARGGQVDARTDLYALGVLMYRMVTGQLPFTCPSPVELVTKHLTETPINPRTLVQNLPGEIEDLILQLMEKKPDNRPESARQVRSRLSELKESLSEELAPLVGENSPPKCDESDTEQPTSPDALVLQRSQEEGPMTILADDTDPATQNSPLQGKSSQKISAARIRNTGKRWKRPLGFSAVALVLMGAALGINGAPPQYQPIPAETVTTIPPTPSSPIAVTAEKTQKSAHTLESDESAEIEKAVPEKLEAETAETPQEAPSPIKPEEETGQFEVAEPSFKTSTSRTKKQRPKEALSPNLKTSKMNPAEKESAPPKMQKKPQLPSAELPIGEKSPRENRKMESQKLEMSGDRATQKRKHRKAAALFKKAYKLDERKNLLKKIGRSLLLSGNQKEAKVHLARYLEGLNESERNREEPKIKLWIGL